MIQSHKTYWMINWLLMSAYVLFPLLWQNGHSTNVRKTYIGILVEFLVVFCFFQVSPWRRAKGKPSLPPRRSLCSISGPENTTVFLRCHYSFLPRSTSVTFMDDWCCFIKYRVTSKMVIYGCCHSVFISVLHYFCYFPKLWGEKSLFWRVQTDF